MDLGPREVGLEMRLYLLKQLRLAVAKPSLETIIKPREEAERGYLRHGAVGFEYACSMSPHTCYWPSLNPDCSIASSKPYKRFPVW